MAFFDWKNGVGSYLDASQWSPAAVPLYGSNDVTIAAGVATLTNAQPNGIALRLGGALGAELLLDNAALGESLSLSFVGKATIGVRGYDTSYASMSLASALLIDTGAYGQLSQYGTITVRTGGVLTVGPAGRLNNGGTIEVAGGVVAVADDMVGNGTIRLDTETSLVTLSGAVSPGATIALRAGTLHLTDFSAFGGTLSQFDTPTARLVIDGLDFDTAAAGSGGVLQLSRNGQVVGQVALADSAATAYSVWRNADGSRTVAPADFQPGQVHSDGSIPYRIDSGVVVIRNAAPNGQRVSIGNENPANQPTLILDNAALGPQLSIDIVSAAGAYHDAYATIGVRGYDTIEGGFYLGGALGGNADHLTIALDTYGQLNIAGTIGLSILADLAVKNMDASAPGRLNNGGIIDVSAGQAAIMTDLVGTGILQMDPSGKYGSGRVELGGAVSSGQTIRFLGGTLTLDHPELFRAALSDFSGFDTTLVLRGIAGDAAALQAGPDGSFLNVTLAGTLVDQIRLAGVLPSLGLDAHVAAGTNDTIITQHRTI